MKTRRKERYVARQVYLGPRGLEIDGVHLPWEIVRPGVDDLGMEGRIWGLTVTLLADRVIVNSPNGEYPDRDTLMEECRAEAIAIVREGLADIIAALPEEGR